MKKFLVTNVWWLTLVLATLLLGAHVTSFGDLKIDTIALALLAIILLSPFASAVRRIKIGDFEAEIAPKEVAEVREEVAEQVEARAADPDHPDERPPLIYQAIEHITTLAESEPLLALVQLRIEIERVTNRLARRLPEGHRSGSRPRPLGLRLDELAASRVLPVEVIQPLRRVLDITNRAAHGEAIRPEDAVGIVDAGTSLLEQIHWHAYDLAEAETKHIEMDPSEVLEYERAQYELTTVTPVLDHPRRSVKIVSQDELDHILDGYSDYAEFIVELRRIGDRPEN